MMDTPITATHHPIFEKFRAVECKGTGKHVFDFLGGITRVSYKRGLEKHAIAPDQTFTPNLPPKNEHYLDWIALLTAVSRTRSTFRMAELGAGWAPWLVRGAKAARQIPEIERLEFVAVEADPTHYSWALEHFRDNGLDPDAHHMLHGAVAGQPGPLRFPAIADPDVDYGASLGSARNAAETVEVRGYSLAELVGLFTGPIDLLHVDIQGAEYEALPPAIRLLSRSARAIMVGTHRKDSLHDDLAARFRDAGWTERLNLGRNLTTPTPWGDIATNDGFLWFENRVLAGKMI